MPTYCLRTSLFDWVWCWYDAFCIDCSCGYLNLKSKLQSVSICLSCQYLIQIMFESWFLLLLFNGINLFESNWSCILSSALTLLCVIVQFSFGIIVWKSGLKNQCDITKSAACCVVSLSQIIYIHWFPNIQFLCISCDMKLKFCLFCLATWFVWNFVASVMLLYYLILFSLLSIVWHCASWCSSFWPFLFPCIRN